MTTWRHYAYAALGGFIMGLGFTLMFFWLFQGLAILAVGVLLIWKAAK